ncbi:ras GEF [Lanmaoa asiatica]|nr:ras GEF [Lanmaoa asiatica]
MDRCRITSFPLARSEIQSETSFQIYYANTLTGKLSRDLPRDSGDDVSDSELVGLTAFQSSSRSGNGDDLGFVPVNDVIELPRDDICLQTELPEAVKVNDTVSPPAFQVSDIPQTPKSLPVPLDAGVTTARPRANTDLSSSNRHSNRVSDVFFDSLTAQSRHRSHSASDPSHLSLHQRSTSSEQHASPPHSNTSRFLVVREASHFTGSTRLSDIPDTQELPRAVSPQPSMSTIPQPLTPPAPDLVSELLQRARQSIHSVILHLRQFGIPQVTEDEEIVDNLISAAITAIRDLLGTNNASQTPLVPAQRRAVATLSKFVLSARAVLNDGPWITSDNVSQLSSDAEELERSVIEFVSIAQGVRSQGALGSRRLHGYFAAPYAGPTKAGAGTAGTWRGFGWVNIEDHEEAPRQNLTMVTFNEFVNHISRVQERLSTLTEVLRETRPGIRIPAYPIIPGLTSFVFVAEVVTTSAQELFRQLSSLVLFLGDIHIARHVDIETVDQARLPDGAQYMRTVEKARVLVRSLEATTQAIYDDGAALLVTTQRIRRVEPCESWKGRDTAYDALEALGSSLEFNLKISRQNLEGLLRIGTEQSAILERCHKTPVEWRMSQRSLVAAILANQALEAIYNNRGTYDVTADEPDRILKSVAEDDVDEPPSPSPRSPVPPPVPTSGKSFIIPRNQVPTQNSSEDDEALATIRTPARPDKIRAFFGDDAPSHYLISLSAETKPWYLRPNYNPEEVLIDPDGTVRGGTVLALVERLTAHEYAGKLAFLMTFKSFMTLDKLFNLLVERFWIQPPPKLSSHELEDWRYNKQNIIRIRVINTMKLIVQDEDLVDKEDLGILNRVAQFASGNDVSRVPAAKPLLAAIKRAHEGSIKKVTHQSTVSPPAPIVPKRIELLDIDPLELARQLTITESHLYLKIRPSECLQRSKQSQTVYHDGVANFIRRSNRIAHWVTYSILCKDDPRRRAAVMKQFILVADRCRVIQNFSTMMAVVTGLNSSPIHRLKRSWEQVNSRHMSQLETCETLINSYKHYNNYRSTLATVAPPCVPFVGVFLTALTHIQDGSKDYLPGDLVNFRKRQKSSEVIQDLQRWQTQPHNFHLLPSVLVFIDESLSQFGDHDASEVFWKLSLEREPREKDEERLAKWLTESGFF